MFNPFLYDCQFFLNMKQIDALQFCFQNNNLKWRKMRTLKTMKHISTDMKHLFIVETQVKRSI